MTYIQHYNSPLGGILLAADEIGLTGLWFEGQKYFARDLSDVRIEQETPVLAEAKRWLDSYFTGKEPDFTPPLHPVGSAFRRSVWEILLHIPYGQTTTYGEIARQLAERQGVSAAYLEQLIASLKKAGLVTALRGVQGGYVLARSPELISVGEVLRVLEGSTAIVDCVGTTGTDCSNVCSCSARPLWLKLQRRIDDVLNTTSVRDLADDYITQMERNQDNK